MIVWVVGLIVARTSPGKVSPSSTARTWLPLGESATETAEPVPAMPVPLVAIVVVSVCELRLTTEIPAVPALAT